mmetsp:Transcript_21678/g.15970  ORF Transcript_21678/g.15970 Transcript_21678/m.15970 type:complete len:122 (-) Transcript_21678:32-397(-)
MLAKKTFELNPHHPVIKEMLTRVKNLEENPGLEGDLGDYTDMLFNMAMLNSGFLIDNPSDLTIPMQKLLKVGLGLSREAEVEEIEIDISTLDEEDDKALEEEEEVEVEGEVEEEALDKDEL